MDIAQQSARSGWLPSWLRAALVVGLGGMLFVGAMLWMAQGFIGERLISGTIQGVLYLCLAALVASLVALAGLWIAGYRPGAAAPIVLVWLVCYALLWAAGSALGSVSLPVFLLFWAVVGGLAGWALAPGLSTPPTGGGARAARGVARSNEYGRVPAQTVVLLNQLVHHTRTSIVPALPAGAPRDVWDWTTEAVLGVLMRDWWKGGNEEGLRPRDVEDLRSFVALAASLADDAGTLRSPVGQAAFRGALAALLEDWLESWNADGVDGPPRR